MTRQPDYWFKARRFGWGWYPASWQGWVILAVHLLLIILAFWGAEEDAPLTEIWPRLVFTLLVVASLMFISFKKGETPRWRWGNEIEE